MSCISILIQRTPTTTVPVIKLSTRSYQFAQRARAAFISSKYESSQFPPRLELRFILRSKLDIMDDKLYHQGSQKVKF